MCIIENNVDQLWDQCEEQVRSPNSLVVLDPEYTGYTKEAFGVFLMELFKSDKEKFIEILDKFWLICGVE